MKCILMQRFPSAFVLWALTMTAWSHTFSWGWPGTREALCCWTSPEMCSTARWYSSLAKLQGKSTGVTAGLHFAVLITRLAHKAFPGPQGGGDVETSCQLPMGVQGMNSRLAGALLRAGVAEPCPLRNHLAPEQLSFPNCWSRALNVPSSCRSPRSSCRFPRELS